MAVTLVAYAYGGGGAGGTALLPTFNVATTGATLIVVSVSHFSGGSSLAVADNLGNGYTPLSTYEVGVARHTLFYSLTGLTSATHTLIVAGSSIYPAVVAYAFSGVAGYDGQQNGATGSASPLACGSVTPSTNGALVVTGMSSDPSATDAAPAGFTGPITLLRDTISGGNLQGSAAFLIQSTAAAINPAWPWTGTHTAAAASVAVFVPAASTVAVPDVVGDLQADAATAITAVGLTVGTVTTAVSDLVPAGHVISQSPTAGTVVALGTAVDLVIAVTPGLVILIDGDPWKFRAGSLTIHSTLNGRDTLSGVIDILDGADPPTLNQEITVDEDGVRIYGGLLEELEYRAITSDPDASKDLMVSLGAKDFNALADNRTVASMTSTGGLTLKQALTQLVTELAPSGVTLSPTQVDGPVLPSFAFTLQTVTAILDELSKLTEFVWEIDAYKVLTMWQPGTVAAPFNITDGDGKVWGDIVIRPIASDYANRIIVRAGRDGPYENVFAWYTDGVTNNFPMYLHVLQHFGQVLVDTPLETVPGEGFESVGPPGSGALWEFHDGPRYTQYLSRAAGPPAAGNPVGVVPYPLQFKVIQEEPIVVTADNLAEQAANGIVEKLVDQGPTVSSWWELQAIADSLLGRYASRRYTVQYSTREKGLRVGQSQTMSIARRNLSGPYFITDVDTQMVGSTILKRTVTLNETELFQGSWRDIYKLWAANSSGGGGGSVAVGSTVPIGGTPVPHHVQHEPGGMDPMTVDSTASIGSLRTLGTGVNQAAPGTALANVAYTNLANTFSADQSISKGTPIVRWIDTAAVANKRHFIVSNFSEALWFLALNDANTITEATPLRLDRYGNAIVGADLYEKGRTVGLGHWQAVPFTAAHYVGVAPMTWTVTAGNVKTNRYALVGKTLFWQLAIEGSALGGSASTGVTVLLPAGLVTAAQGATVGREHNAGWRVDAVLWAGAATNIEIWRLDFANYVVPESIFYFYVNVAIEVQ